MVVEHEGPSFWRDSTRWTATVTGPGSQPPQPPVDQEVPEAELRALPRRGSLFGLLLSQRFTKDVVASWQPATCPKPNEQWCIEVTGPNGENQAVCTIFAGWGWDEPATRAPAP